MTVLVPLIVDLLTGALAVEKICGINGNRIATCPVPAPPLRICI